MLFLQLHWFNNPGMQICSVNLTSHMFFLYLSLCAYFARSFTSNDSDRFALVYFMNDILQFAVMISRILSRDRVSSFPRSRWDIAFALQVVHPIALSQRPIDFPVTHALFRSRLRQGGCGCNHGSQCTRHHGQGRTEKADREHEVPGVHGTVAPVKKHRGVSALRRQPNRHLHSFSCLSLFPLAYYLRTPLSI